MPTQRSDYVYCYGLHKIIPSFLDLKSVDVELQWLFFTATKEMKKVIQTQTFFSVNEKGTKNILKCQSKTDKDSGKKCYNNMFCLRWIVFVCPERFGQWQQQYLVSEGITRPKLDSCDSKKLSVARQAANPEPIGKFFFVWKKVFYNFFYVILPRLILCPREWKNVDVAMNFFLIPWFTLNIHKYFPPLMLKQMFFGLPFDGVEVAAGEKTWRKERKTAPGSQKPKFLKTICGGQ